MKATKKLSYRCYAFLVAFVMVISLLSVPAMTVNATEAEIVEADNGEEAMEIGGEASWVNEEYADDMQGIEDLAEEVFAENQAADMADNYINDAGEVVDKPTFKDVNSAADYMRKCFVERRSTIEFTYKLDSIYYSESTGKYKAENTMDKIHDLLYAETPEGDEGDYLYWNTLGYDYEYSGVTRTDVINFKISPRFMTTAAQERVVNQKIDEIINGDLKTWETRADGLIAAVGTGYIMDRFEIGTYTNPVDATAYAGFTTGKTQSVGYATATYRLLKAMGVSTRIVRNYNDDDPHVWNIAGVDGVYYNIDAYYADLTDAFFASNYYEDYILFSDDIAWDVDYDFKSMFNKAYATSGITNPYVTTNHSKDYDYRSDDFKSKYPPATQDFYDYYGDYGTEVTNPTVGVTYRTHVQKEGWQAWKNNGAMSGTSGKGLRLEGIEIKLTGNTGVDLGIEYKTHIQKYGWEAEWKQNGKMSGTSGEAKRLEAIKIRLTGADAAKYDVYYRVHAQSYGWLGWAKNGQEAGTAGQSKRLEGIEIKIVKKGEVPSGVIGYSYIEYGKKAELNSEITGMVNYRTHVQKYGWQGYVYDGSLSGTFGESKRLEGINISLGDTGYSGGITYRTHIQKIGWQDWKSDGVMSGTSGKALRLEAIEIKLTGEVAKHYDVYYRVHAQTFGWLDWAKNGQAAGTAGYGKRLESIQIVLIPKDGTAPGSTSRPFVQK